MQLPEVLRYAAYTINGKGGNPAGVVIDASELTTEEMQTLARVTCLRATAFVTSRDNVSGRAPIRYFSHGTAALTQHGGLTAMLVDTRAGRGQILADTSDGTAIAGVISPTFNALSRSDMVGTRRAHPDGRRLGPR